MPRMDAQQPVTVGVGAPAIEDVVAVARARRAGRALAEDAIGEIERTPRRRRRARRGHRARTTASRPASARWPSRHIPPSARTELQRSLIRSHAAGSGPEVEREVVRALMLLRLSTLATGRTGVRRETAEAYAALLSAGITPVVHEYGSLGCSGDLAPLAHCALALMGEGPVRDAGGASCAPRPTRSRDAGIAPVALAEKEGLALINGTDGMLGMLVLAIADLRHAAHDGRHRGRDERRGPARHRRASSPPTCTRCARIPGQARLGGQHPRGAGRQPDRRQPPRARGHPRPGRLLAALRAAGRRRARATPSTTPRASPSASWRRRSTTRSSLPDGRVESNGNFHGAPVAYVLDFLAIAAADVASIAERRTDRFLDAARSHGLPPFLARRPRRRLRA